MFRRRALPSAVVMDPRRHLTRRNLLRAAGAGAVLAAADGFGLEPYWLEVTTHTLPVADLPTALEGLTIAQITDAHLSRLGRVEDEILAAVRQADAALVVLTGDLIDDMADAPPLAELCAELRRGGAEVVATLGNWERWNNLPVDELGAVYQRSGATLLIDQWHPCEVGGVTLYASDDSTGGGPRPLQANPDGPAPVEILLTHSPAFIDDAAVPDLSFDLCLAGHTHGGQVTALGWPPLLPEGSGRFVAGWYDSAQGPAYVSRGTGTSLIPVRFFCRPELPLIRLTRA
ncbi:MAG: metallophosphoesterase [Myxococcales bacterium]|nr:metallophosphoesterase [Myxococcales bacterium]